MRECLSLVSFFITGLEASLCKILLDHVENGAVTLIMHALFCFFVKGIRRRTVARIPASALTNPAFIFPSGVTVSPQQAFELFLFSIVRASDRIWLS